MKRACTLLIVALFLAGMFIVPVGVETTSARLQETLLNDVNLEHDSELSWIPPGKNVRVAVYNTTNSTEPSYVAGNMVLNNSWILNILTPAGYSVTELNLQDIQNHELQTQNYDVLVLADLVPNENITHLVTEFWLSGGGILATDTSGEYLNFAGILPREAAGTNGSKTYWDYVVESDFNVSTRHPVTKSYEIGEGLSHIAGGLFMWDLSALSGTSLKGDFTVLVEDHDDSNGIKAIAVDPLDKGGRTVHIGIPIGMFGPIGWDEMIVDAVEWLCPRPKARIAFDLTHTPAYGLDDYDGDYCGSTSLKHTQMRDELVRRGYTFDKLYPPSGGELTSSVLSLYDMLVVLSPTIDYTSAEVTVVTNWISTGGSILAISDHYGAAGVSQLNNLLSNTDLTHNMTHEGSSALVQTGFHPTHEGSTDMLGSAVGLIVTSGDAVVTWNDDQGRSVIGADEHGTGRIILAADLALFRDGRLSISDNLESYVSMANWLTSGNANVLAFIDKNTINEDPNDFQYRGPVAQALNELGVSWFFVGEEQVWQYLNYSLYNYDWDLVVIDQFGANLNFLWGDFLNHVKSGERLIYQSMQLNQLVTDAQAFRDYCGVIYPQGPVNPTPPNYFWSGSDQILTNPRNYGANNVSVEANYGFTTCWNLTYHDNGTALAGLSPAKPESNINATSILGVGGNVLVNGMMTTAFDNDTDNSAYKDNFELWENQIAFMLRPIIDSPSDMTIEVGSRSESVTWTPYSFKPASYKIVRNSFEILDEPWDGSPITLDFEEDNLGTETFYITVYDIYGQSEMDEVDVTKEDTTAPTLVVDPDNLEYEEGTILHWVNWTYTEMFPDSYVLYVNGSYETGSAWDGSNISVNVGDFTHGIYNLTIAVNDTSDNLAISTVYLTVSEAPASTTTTTTTTSTSTTTTTTEPIDGDSVIIIIIVVAVVTIVIVVILFMRKRS